MGRKDYEDLIKASDRAMDLLEAWQDIQREKGIGGKQEELHLKIDTAIAGLRRYRSSIKRLLKGEDEPSTQAKLKFLQAEYDKAADQETKKLYMDQIRKIVDEIVTDGLLEVTDV